MHLKLTLKFQIMKKIIIPFLFILITASAYTQKSDTIFTNASLKSATVYFGYGADLHHTTILNLNKGVQKIVIENVSLQPDINTFQISCPENVTILSYSHRIISKPIRSNLPLNFAKSYDTIKLINKQIASIENEIEYKIDAIKRISELIQNNFTTIDKKNISSEELIKLTNFYTEKIIELKKSNYVSLNKIDSCNDKINEINERINIQNIPLQYVQVGQIILQVMSNIKSVVNVDFNYFTNGAGWVPSYDVRVKSIDNSFKLIYKAMVSQTTGLNWSGVKLNLSTSNPNLGAITPLISPIYLQLYLPVLYNEIAVSAKSPAMMKLEDEEISNSSDATFSLRQKKSLLNDDISEQLTLKESQLNTNFEIDLPYDIPSDGLAYSVNIKQQIIPVLYEHIAIPKIENDAFLIAKIVSWDSLNLLPGHANIIMDDIYIGKSYINPNIIDDTLSLSMGRDKRISIERKLVKELNQTKRNDSKIDNYTFEITVKNNKNKNIDMVLKDQFPISKTKEVEVIFKNDSNAEIDTETGIIHWKVSIKPGESKKYRFSYQIKYPKDKIIQETK